MAVTPSTPGVAKPDAPAHTGGLRGVATPLHNPTEELRLMGSRMAIEDLDLAEENFKALNRAFYSASPPQYFMRRIESLILQAGRAEDLRTLLAEGVTYGRLKAKTSPDEPDQEDQRQFENYIATDAEILLHHAAETLIRLYLAHEGLPPCPWLELSRERSFRQFKGGVARRFRGSMDEAARIARSAPVMLGMTSPEQAAAAGVDPDSYPDVMRNVEGALGFFADVVLDQANLYNAAKHGLAIQAGKQSFRIAAEGSEEPFLSQTGAAISYLEVIEKDERRVWSEATRWIDPDRSIGLVQLAAHLLESLWGVARGRYRDQAQAHVFLLGQPIRDIVGFGPSVRSFNRHLLYYRFRLRLGRADDIGVIQDMLYEAAFWEGTTARPSRSEALDAPELFPYWADWGRKGDVALIAESGGERVGAAWYRTFTEESRGYGFIGKDIPELTIGVVSDRRGEGIGKALLEELIEEARTAGVPALSLSVSADNKPAVHLYEGAGFTTLEGNGHSLTMVLDLASDS